MIGQLKKRIKIQVLTIVDTPGGGAEEQWADELTTWAKVEPLRSNRTLQDNQIVLMDGYKITIRWADNRIMDKKRRIIYKNKNLTINSVVELDEAKRFYEITAVISE